ncbi:MAG: hypothetical protein AB1465_07400, partial [Patescibacteria group bacterium]
MAKDLKEFILNLVKKQREVKSSQVVKESGFSRVYINRFFRQLVAEGKIELIGKANQARYILAGKSSRLVLSVNRLLKNRNLNEDAVFQEIQKTADIFRKISKNVENILSYSFSEMLNNAIEHSQSKQISIRVNRTKKDLKFIVRDYGVGVFRNARKKFHLKNELDAINHL